MTPKEFRKLVATYGSDLARWPGDQRAQAQALTRATPELRALLAEAAQLDQALRALGSGSDLAEPRLRKLIQRAAREIAVAPQSRRTVRARAAEDC